LIKANELTLRKLLEMAQSINFNQNILDIPLDVRVAEKSIFEVKSANCEGMHVHNGTLVIDFLQTR
jgi:hypothetical protein